MIDQRRSVKREHVVATSGDISQAQVARLRQLFPEVFVEGKIDFDKLKITLGAAAESGPGRFYFRWAGKRRRSEPIANPERWNAYSLP